MRIVAAVFRMQLILPRKTAAKVNHEGYSRRIRSERRCVALGEYRSPPLWRLALLWRRWPFSTSSLPTGYGLLPAVVRTSGNTGPWDRPRSARTVHLADGSTARERVTAYERPVYFAYRTSDHTFALRHFASFAEGQWWFEDDGSGTRVRWTYTFSAENWLALVPLALFVRTQWVGYMRTCIRNVQHQFWTREP